MDERLRSVHSNRHHKLLRRRSARLKKERGEAEALTGRITKGDVESPRKQRRLDRECEDAVDTAHTAAEHTGAKGGAEDPVDGDSAQGQSHASHDGLTTQIIDVPPSLVGGSRRGVKMVMRCAKLRVANPSHGDPHITFHCCAEATRGCLGDLGIWTGSRGTEADIFEALREAALHAPHGWRDERVPT